MSAILWSAAKIAHEGKYIAVKAYIRKQEESQVNNLSFHVETQDGGSLLLGYWMTLSS